MTYPKMIFRSDAAYPDDEALKQGLAATGGVQKLVVNSEAEEAEAVADGWTDNAQDFVGEPSVPRARRGKAKDASA